MRRATNHLTGNLLQTEGFFGKKARHSGDPGSRKIRVDKSQGTCQDLQGIRKKTGTNEAN